ncbi:MAG: ABC transporter substrate-binding protein, partial [Desulfomonilia bacterium]
LKTDNDRPTRKYRTYIFYRMYTNKIPGGICMKFYSKEKIAISISWLFIFILLLSSVGFAVSTEKKLVFADVGWDSVQVNNRIAKFILENGYRYEVELVAGETIPLFAGLVRGDVDVNMECWVENQQDAYDKAIANGSVVDLGSNFPDSWQGWLVPTYVIKGDPERGIKPIAPDLKSVFDMPKYWEHFKDPEDPTKGAFYSCIPGWECEKINEKKFETYGLKERFNIILPGSNAALVSSMASAYKKGKPWFGYYWEPTWPLGKYDMTRLEEPPYDKELWDAGRGCAYPPTRVNIVVNSSLLKTAPDVVEFLKKYETTAALHNKVLAYMEDNKANVDDAAIWFLKEYESLWSPWVPADVKENVKEALK